MLATTVAPAEVASADISCSRSPLRSRPNSSATIRALSPVAGRSNKISAPRPERSASPGLAAKRRSPGANAGAADRGDDQASDSGPWFWCGITTGREGTTVEIACLYTICVTVFLSSTTY